MEVHVLEQKFIELLENNASLWNDWRSKYPEKTPSLRNVEFVNELMKNSTDIYDLPNFMV